MANIAQQMERSNIKFDDFRDTSALTVFFNQANDLIEPYFGNFRKRDAQLRNFAMSEPYMSAALFAISSTRAALSYFLDGPPKSVAVAQDILQNAEFGKGWAIFMQKIIYDLLTTDNGAFIEISRVTPKGRRPETGRIVGINHLDSLNCILTGNPEKPVIYVSTDNKYHEIPWYNIIHLVEQPHPSEKAMGRQVCFVSRVIKAAQLVKDMTTYESERIGGRFSQELNIVSGVSQKAIDRVRRTGQIDADNQGFSRFMPSLMLASLDPNAKVEHVAIPFAKLPENFNRDEVLKDYVALLAMAGGVDIQELQALSGGSLGSSSQSSTLHQKSKVKGIQLFIKLIEQGFRNKKVIPKNVNYGFVQRDIEEELQQAKASRFRAETRKIRIESGELNIEVARQIASDDQDLKQIYLIQLGEQDATPTVEITDTETVSEELMQQGLGNKPKLEKSVNDENIDSEKDISIKLAWETAKIWVKEIENSPVQSYSPISDGKLLIFAESLRNRLAKETVLYTNSNWQCSILTLAAKDAGIHAHLLRHRLPDNFSTYTSNGKIYTTSKVLYEESKVIKTKEIKTSIAVKSETCHMCNNNHYKYIFTPLGSWESSCKDHTYGLKGNATESQYTFEETIDAFREQWISLSKSEKQGLYLATLSSLVILKNKRMDEPTRRLITKELRSKEGLLIFTNKPDIFVLGLTKFYLEL